MRTFTLEVDRELGALERVLGIARRRGLGIERVVAQAAGPRWNIEIRAGAHPADAALALAQWNALVDVRRATMEE